MKRIIVAMVSVLVLSNFAFAAEKAPAAKTETLSGIIIDNACAQGNKEKLGEFVKTHTKDCALMPNCAASGYSVYLPDGQLLAFTKGSNKKIIKYLKGKKNTLNVELTVKRVKDELKLVTIKNREA